MNGWKQNLVRTYDGKLKVYNPITRQMEDFEGGAVPEYSSEDAGKVLTVSDTGELEWSEGGGSGGGGTVFLSTNANGILTYNGNVLTKNQFDDLYANNAIIFYMSLDGDYSDFGYVASYDDSNNITIIETTYDITNDDGGSWSKMVFRYDSINDCWVWD